MCSTATAQISQVPDWNNVIPALTRYAGNLMHSHVGPGGCNSLDGREASDFTQAAIRKLYTGERKWNPASCPNLLHFLKGVVRSDIYEARRRAARIMRMDFVLPEPSDATHEPEHRYPIDPQLLVARVDAEVGKRKDPLLAACWNAFLQDDIHPAVLSETLNVPVIAIYNARRRFKALLDGIRRTLDKQAAKYQRIG